MAGHQDADFDALLEQSSLGGPAATRLRARTPLSWARIVRRITERSEARENREDGATARLREHHQQLIAEMTKLAHASGMTMLDNLPQGKREQMLFVHQEYELLLLSHRVGLFSWDELLSYLQRLTHNQLFREYWEMTREHRRSIPPRSSAACMGTAVDGFIEETADDPDEWWVVGQPNDS
ncbi:DUF6082 family protein [Streptomyces sp. NPDC093568]|uniref:DUF6082 family protein n=1 Tax=Streptomyces sp. NPDC093568 TaxID=3366041 RepID=UPI00382CE24C